MYTMIVHIVPLLRSLGSFQQQNSFQIDEDLWGFYLFYAPVNFFFTLHALQLRPHKVKTGPTYAPFCRKTYRSLDLTDPLVPLL